MHVPFFLKDSPVPGSALLLVYKKSHSVRANGHNIVGCYMLGLLSCTPWPVACLKLVIVASCLIHLHVA